VLEPFVLPAQGKFSSPEAFNRASGPKKWNRQQGFYIYRADRMIQSGGWSNLRTLDEHIKLARVALYFSPKLDDEFKINVPKMRIALPATIRADVLKAIGPVLKLANTAYRSGEKGEKGNLPGPTVPGGTSAPTGGGGGATAPTPAPGPAAHPSGTKGGAHTINATDFVQVQALLERVARPDELPVIHRVVARARRTFAGQ
jgi:hypothetical protein